MSEIIKKTQGTPSNVSTNLNVGVYTIYDTVLHTYDVPFSVPVTKIDDYLKCIVNDTSSKYYNHESDYIVNKIGDFNTDSGEIVQHFVERVSILDRYIDKQQRNLQTIIKTLNFLPAGYFKMPAEQKQSIQEQINECINKYVQDYVVPDLDIQKEKKRLFEEEKV